MKTPFSVRKWLNLGRFWDTLFAFGATVRSLFGRRLASARSDFAAFRSLRRFPRLEGLEDRQLMAGQVGFATGGTPWASESAGSISFTVVTIDRPSNDTETVTVDYYTASPSGGATPGDDYTAASGTLTFAPGVNSQSVTVTLLGDSVDEEDEEYVDIYLSNPTNATLSSDYSHILWSILDDDALPTLSVADVSVTEGTGSGSTTMSFNVSLTGATSRTVTVGYATEDGTATGDDYTSTSGMLTFSPGQTSKTVSVTITRDAKDEENQAVLLNLSSPTNATIADDEGVGTINDDDDPPTISVGDVSVTEGTGGGDTTMTFTVSLSSESEKTVTVNYATADGTATDTDYTSASGTLTFSAGETSKTVDVAIVQDAKDEENQTVLLNLSAASNATIADSQGVGTINDDDDPPTISVDDVSVTEGTGAGSTTMTFTVSLSAESEKTVTVNYATANGTATGTDYTSTSGTLTFSPGAPGETSKTVNVSIVRDAKDEHNQTVLLNVSSPNANATIADGQGEGTIEDDDGPPTVKFEKILFHGDEDDGTATIKVVLSAPSEISDSTIWYKATGDTCGCYSMDVGFDIEFYDPAADITPKAGGNSLAYEDEDFIPIFEKQLVIPIDEIEATFTVSILNDSYEEAPKDVELEILRAEYATLGTPDEAKLTIVDDDASATYDGDNLTNVGFTGGSGRSYTYNANGQFTSKTNELGNRSTYTYDGNGYLATAVDPTGATTTYVHSSGGLLLSRTDPDPDGAGPLTASTTTYAYSGTRLTQITYPDLTTRNYTYTSEGQVETEEDETGGVTTYTYNGVRLTNRTDPNGGVTTYTYTTNGDLATVVDPLNRVTTYLRDTNGRIDRVVQPDGGTTTYTYNSLGQRTSTTDPLGRVTTLTYNANGRLEATISPDGTRVTTLYDYVNRTETSIGADGQRTTTTLDLRGNDIAVAESGGSLSTTVYDVAGQAIASIDPYGNRTTTVYDAAGRAIATIDSSGQRTTTLYDARGRATGSVDPYGNRTTAVYDARGRAVASVDADGNVTTTVYDAAGRAVASIDPYGSVTTTVYDAAGRAVESIDPFGNVSTTVYDAAGRVVASIDPDGNRTTSVYDAAGRVIESIDPYGAVTTTVYDAAGQRLASIDSYGFATTYVYEASGRQVAIIDAYGHRSTTVYDAAGRAEATIDVFGNRTTSVYDSQSRQVATIDPLGNRTTTVYDAQNRVEATIDPLGNRTTTVYDSQGRHVATIDPLGLRTTTVYDSLGRAHASIDPHGNRTTTLYDSRGRAYVSVDALGQRVTTHYDATGRVESVQSAHGYSTTIYDSLGRAYASVDAVGARATTLYDSRGRTEASLDAFGNAATTVYDARGRAHASIDPLGHRTTVVFDSLGRTEAAVNALGQRVTTVYDARGRAEASIDALGNRTTTLYDAYGRSEATVDALGNTATAVYDDYGRVVAQIDPLGNRTTTLYDAYGRVSATQNALGQRVTTVYDSHGRVSAQIDPLGNRTTTLYDSYGRHETTVDALTGRVTYVYDSHDRRTAVVDPVGNRTTSVYDVFSREIETIDPTNESATFAYDALGRLSSSTDRLGRRRDFAYDAGGRKIGETWIAADGSTVVDRATFVYDARGSQLTAADGDGKITMTYDALGRVETVIQANNVRMTFVYDAAGNRTVVQDSFGGIETSTYDAVRNLTSRQLSTPVDGGPDATLREDFTYDAASRRLSDARYADLSASTLVARTTTTYDALGRILDLETRDSSSTLLAEYAYTYDAAGRLTSKTDDGAVTTYAYDATSQLTGEDATGSSNDRTYSYDANGNRTMSGYSHGSDNRLATDGVWDYAYDDEGSMIEKERISDGLKWTYQYDHRNQLVKLEQATNGTDVDLRIEYKYDVWGNRIARSIDRDADGILNPEVMQFALDGWSPAKPSPIGTENVDVWADLEVDGTLATRYLRSDRVDELLARIDDLTGDPTKYWTVADHLGSTRKLLDADAAVANAITHDGYGNIVSETDDSVRGRYAWTGREVDVEAGLQYNRARVYDTGIGQWISKDPLGFGAGDSNLYRYVYNIPLVLADASGHQAAPYTVDGKFKGGKTTFSAVDAIGETSIGGGILIYLNEKTDKEREWNLDLLEKLIGRFGIKWEIRLGVNATVVANFDKDAEKICYFWSQEYQYRFSGLGKIKLPNDVTVWSPDQGKIYPGQNLGKNPLEMRDSPGLLQKEGLTKDMLADGKTKGTILLKAMDAVNRETRLEKWRKDHFENQTKGEWRFRTHLMYIDPATGTESTKGTYHWSLRIRFDKQNDKIVPAVDFGAPDKLRWEEAK